MSNPLWMSKYASGLVGGRKITLVSETAHYAVLHWPGAKYWADRLSGSQYCPTSYLLIRKGETQQDRLAVYGGAMTLDEGLELFKQVMKAKFEARAEKYGAKSLTLASGLDWLRQPETYIQLKEHLIAEVKELEADWHCQEEKVDVANMAFELWWADLEG